MADQDDFPDIYIDASATGPSYLGSEVDPYDQFSDINWTTGGDNSVFDYYAGTPAASVTVNLKKGETWRENVTIGHSGTVAYPVVFQAYDSGADPIISGADLVTPWTTALTTEPLVAASGDDSYILETDENVSHGSTSLYMGLHPTGPQQSSGAVRFILNVPQGATITAAYVTVTAKNNNDDGFVVDVYAHDDDDAGAITDFAKWTTALAAKTAASTNWDFPAVTTNTGYSSPSIVDIVQEIVDRGGWVSGNHITILLDSSVSTKLFQGYSFDSGSNIPYLHVEYSQTNTSQATLTHDPNSVALDGVLAGEVTTGTGDLAANQWFYNSADNALIVRTDGTAIATIEVEAGRAAQNYVIRTNSQSYLTFQDIAINGPSLNSGAANEDSTGGVGLVFDTCTFKNYWVAGIYVVATGNEDIGVTVQDCTFTDAGGQDVIRVTGDPDATNTISTIQDNTFSTSAIDGTAKFGATSMGAIEITDGTAVTISGNTIDFTSATPGAGYSGNTIDLADCGTILVEDNSITKGGHGVAVDTPINTAIVRRNLFANIGDDAIWFHTGGDGPQIYYNIINGTQDDGIVVQTTTGADIYNNVIAYCVDTGLCVTGNNATVRNNILFENGQPGTPHTGDESGHEVIVSSTTGFTSDNNTIYHTQAKQTTEFMRWDGTSYTWADWLTNSSQDANSLNTDPLLTNPASDDFTLQVGSPCINAGTDVGLTADYDGNIVGALPDIGAYELQGALGKGGEFHMFMDLSQT